MSSWVAGLELARVLALKMREESGTETPEEFADYRGIELREAPLEGMRAQLVVGPRGAHIRLSDVPTDPAERRWSIAHELGHYELRHPAPPAAELCTPRPRHRGPRSQRDDEDEANEWAMMYTMPDSEVASLCDRTPMTLDVVGELARRCDVPLIAAAIRLTAVTFRACAAVLSHQGAIRWVSPSLRFLGYTHRTMRGEGQPIGRGSLARRFFDTGLLRSQPTLVPAAAWIDCLSDQAWIQEHSVETGEPGTVLTMLWASGEPAMARDVRLIPRMMPITRDTYLSDEQALAQFAADAFPKQPCPCAPTWLEFVLRLDRPPAVAGGWTANDAGQEAAKPITAAPPESGRVTPEGTLRAARYQCVRGRAAGRPRYRATRRLPGDAPDPESAGTAAVFRRRRR